MIKNKVNFVLASVIAIIIIAITYGPGPSSMFIYGFLLIFGLDQSENSTLYVNIGYAVIFILNIICAYIFLNNTVKNRLEDLVKRKD